MFCLQAIFITSVLEYVPPEFGTYTYSSLARAMGWLTVAVGISPMVIQAIYQLTTVKGSLFKVGNMYLPFYWK